MHNDNDTITHVPGQLSIDDLLADLPDRGGHHEIVINREADLVWLNIDGGPDLHLSGPLALGATPTGYTVTLTLNVNRVRFEHHPTT